MLPAVPLNLQQTPVVAHYPVLTDGALLLKAEHFLQPTYAGLGSMKVFFRCRHPTVAPVVLGQIGLLEELVGGPITGDLLTPQPLDQPVLMGAMMALHSAFGLR
jgi:hypothetical protein